ncbi:MAG: c-type cytochrome [Gallionellaceae bacterium]|nr:c-type cytochrome [Gallionellaceae bacterium]MDD5366258.1 c-type cytochrome [Gallionellaceae bacterium]
MHRFIYCIVLAGLAACGGQKPAATASAAGEAKFASVCQDCHGPRGQGQGRFPKLAGRPAAELATRLRQYKAGHKSGNMSDTMRPFAQALSEQEIDQVAAYLAAQ